MYDSFVAACDQTNIMALPTKVGSCGLSLAVDTGATVNVLSEESFKAVKRSFRGGKWPLRQSDLNVRGVTGSALRILSIVTLPVQMKRGIPIRRMDFYVASNFQLPAGGLLGITEMRSNHIAVLPNSNSIIIHGKQIKAMNEPMPLAPLHDKLPWRADKRASGTLDDSTSRIVPSVHAPSTFDTRDDWKYVKATVVGNHEIPDRVAMHIPISLPHAPIESDVCFTGPCKPKRLAMESTFSTVREGHVASALVVTTTGGPVRVKHGVYLGDGLVYDRKLLPTPLEFPTACVAAMQSSADIELGQDPTLSSLVNVVDYPEQKHLLLDLLHEYRDAIALPGEPLGSTEHTEHRILLKPNTKPVYIPAYRLPHSQRAIVDKNIRVTATGCN